MTSRLAELSQPGGELGVSCRDVTPNEQLPVPERVESGEALQPSRPFGAAFARQFPGFVQTDVDHWLVECRNELSQEVRNELERTWFGGIEGRRRSPDAEHPFESVRRNCELSVARRGAANVRSGRECSGWVPGRCRAIGKAGRGCASSEAVKGSASRQTSS